MIDTVVKQMLEPHWPESLSKELKQGIVEDYIEDLADFPINAIIPVCRRYQALPRKPHIGYVRRAVARAAHIKLDKRGEVVADA